MLLFAHGIGFADPPLHLGVEFFFRRDAKFMDVAARSELLDLPKPRMAVPAGKPERAEQIRFARADSREPHSDLKDDPCLLRNDPHRPAP